MAEDNVNKQVYSTPYYQLIRQIAMLIMMMITVTISIMIEAFQGAMNVKLDDLLKLNLTKT